MLKSAGGGFARAVMVALNWRPLWIGLGGANVLVGVVIALRPLPQSQDLVRVALASRDWLFHGVNPYAALQFATNYPPYALAFLFPLGIVPDPLLNATWAIANVGLAVLVAWLGRNVIPAHGRGGAALLGIGSFLSWESVRIGLGDGQFTLLALAGGLAAVSSRGTIGRAMFLAIAMIKPQVGLAFALWAVLDGSARSVLLAGIPLLSGTLAFAWRLGDGVFHVAALYGGVLRHELTSSAFRQGAVELRPLLRDLIAQPAMADAVHGAVAVATLAILVATCRRMSRLNRELFLLPLACVWTLIAVYHPAYDLVLLWPVVVAVWSSLQQRPKPLAVGALAALQLALVVDVPGLWWKLSGRPVFMVHGSALAGVLQHFDRLMVVALFAGLIAASTRWRPTIAAPITLLRNAC